MRGILRLTLVVLLGSLTACHTGSSEGSAQSKGQTTAQQSLSTKLEGHYEGTKLDFHQDAGSGGPAAIDLEPMGTCLYSDQYRGKRPCHWERSTGGITVHVTECETLPFQWANGKLSHLERDGIGGGVCIELVKDTAVSDAGAGLCSGVMMGLPPPPRR